jgi:hypothetical protein
MVNQSTETTPAFTLQKRRLEDFQANRIRSTYADLADTDQYRKLALFFFEQIYGPRDFGFRNQSMRTLHRKLGGILKGDIIETVGKVIELHDLSDALDDQMVGVMMARGIESDLTPSIYRSVYRACDNYEQRVAQIDLMIDAVLAVHRLSKMRWIGFSLKTVSGAARLAGMAKIMAFLIQGYDAFRSVKEIHVFTRTVHTRETTLNNDLFGIHS